MATGRYNPADPHLLSIQTVHRISDFISITVSEQGFAAISPSCLGTHEPRLKWAGPEWTPASQKEVMRKGSSTRGTPTAINPREPGYSLCNAIH